MELEVTVLESREEAPGVRSFTLRTANGTPLPEWRPGEHIDVDTPSGPRQYSICGGNDDEWQIAVLDQSDGLGGSRWMHSDVHVADRLRVSAPRDTFGFCDADSYLFIAGGIGITPILPMIEAAEVAGAETKVVYTARETGAHAFVDRLQHHGDLARWVSADRGRINVAQLLSEVPANGKVFCCGPVSMIDEVREVATQLGISDQVFTEKFEASEIDSSANEEFDVTLANSGVKFFVGPEENLLDRLAENGMFVPSSCRAGFCGSCEIPVLEGDIDHRDEVLTEEERAENDCMFPCVSRAARPGLVLDL